MEINYFDLSGGINQSLTKTEMGSTTKTLFWHDAENIEIYNNRGIIRQQGNTLLLSLPEDDGIIAMGEMESDNKFKLIIATNSGKIYVYSKSTETLTLLNKTIIGKKIDFIPFLRGMIVSTDADEMFYIKDNENFDVMPCNLQDKQGNSFYPNCVTVYKGRIWCAKESTIYYSALGTFNDFTTADDAGYISDFHTDTSDILGLHTYKDYLAIYKRNKIYLLSGSNPTNFSITYFAEQGTRSRKTVINVDNKQYFLSNGIYSLEEIGELNQIRLGSEISKNIKQVFENFDDTRLSETFALNYSKKNQTWFFFPFLGNRFYNTIWINDYFNKAWYKRVLPQEITCACVFKTNILTADNSGNIYIEDFGTSFNGEPIKFLWKSPFLSLGNVHHRKLIDEFYFVLDDLNSNKFICHIYKDYDSLYSDDYENINSTRFDCLVWANENSDEGNEKYCWANINKNVPVWSIGTDVLEKAEICGSCYSVQICIEGKDISDNCAIIGLQFREIYNDD